jgi:predicted transcriptional regulator
VSKGSTGGHPARLTLYLGVFLLILLIFIPFVISSDAYIGFYAYLIYSKFLTCIGILIGSATTWLQLENIRKEKMEGENTVPLNRNIISAKNWNVEERMVISYLLENDKTSWQAQIGRNMGFNASKISRLMVKLEQKNAIERHRDGMGNRVVLVDEVKL